MNQSHVCDIGVNLFEEEGASLLSEKVTAPGEARQGMCGGQPWTTPFCTITFLSCLRGPCWAWRDNCNTGPGEAEKEDHKLKVRLGCNIRLFLKN
jgi:hypothetical protein